MDSRIKVALVVESTSGGIRQHVYDIVSRLDIEKYNIYLIYSDLRADDTFFEQLEELSKKASLIKCNEMQREIGLSDIKAYKKILGLFKAINPDIVHCHSSKAGILGRLAGKVCKVGKIIYTPNAYAFQSPEISFKKKKLYVVAERFLSRKCCDMTINVSNGEMYEALNNNIDEKNKFTLIYNGIPEIDIPDKKELRNHLLLKSDVTYVGFTGRCVAQKDPFTFLEIAKTVLKQKEKVEFLYIGDGDLQESMEQWIEKENLQDKIHMLGFRKDASKIVGTLDIYLSTALYEGLPYSMIEAMRAGVPIIATNCVGNNELVFDGVNGKLFEIRNIEEGSRMLLKQLDEHMIEGKNVRDTFRKEFSLEVMMEKLLKIYENG